MDRQTETKASEMSYSISSQKSDTKIAVSAKDS